jgi:hypothetical protein
VASIVGKKQVNRTYYYLVESARVGGKPRIVSQQYLGSAEEIAVRLSGVAVGEPARTRMSRFLLKFGGDPDLVQATSA